MNKLRFTSSAGMLVLFLLMLITSISAIPALAQTGIVSPLSLKGMYGHNFSPDSPLPNSSKGVSPMRHLYYDWLISLGMFGLILILAACGGGSTGPTTGSTGNGSASPTTNTGNTTPTPTPAGTSTITFTASGGLSGPYMLTTAIESNDNQLVTTPKNKKLTIKDISNTMIITFTVLPYTGPGSYTLSNKYFPDNSQSQTVEIQSGLKVWGGYKLLSPTWTCPLTIASDTAATITVGGNPLAIHEIRGSFSCSMVLSALNTDPPVNLSHGQFDVFVSHLIKQGP